MEAVAMSARKGHGDDGKEQGGADIDVIENDIDDAWTRDTGPTFVVDGSGQIAGCDWRFNAWGGGQQSHPRDALLAKAVLEKLNLRRFAAPFILEGGAIHVDGNGTCLTT